MKKLRITFNAPVVLSLVGLSFIATLLNYITGGKLGQLLFIMWYLMWWTAIKFYWKKWQASNSLT